MLAAWLNASPVRACADSVAERAANGFRRYFSWVISLLSLPLPLQRVFEVDADIPALLSANPDLLALLELSRKLHEGVRPKGFQQTLDGLVAALYEEEGPCMRS